MPSRAVTNLCSRKIAARVQPCMLFYFTESERGFVWIMFAVLVQNVSNSQISGVAIENIGMNYMLNRLFPFLEAFKYVPRDPPGYSDISLKIHDK